MSRPRLYDSLSMLFEQKDDSLLKECLYHPQYQEFMNAQGIKIPLSHLVIAFTHTSFSHEFKAPHQETLEFLGDSVLQLILTQELFDRFPEEQEGKLSKLRSSLVNEKALSQLAKYLKLDELILVGKGEFKKKLNEQEVVLADTFEALLGQVYRHQGFDFCQKLVLRWFKEALPMGFELEGLSDFDFKSKLQERALAKFKKLPRYSSNSVGDKFEIQVWINEELMASGIFSSKKNGEKELAQDILKKNLI